MDRVRIVDADGGRRLRHHHGRGGDLLRRRLRADQHNEFVLDVTAWGWTHLVLGILLALVGCFVLRGALWTAATAAPLVGPPRTRPRTWPGSLRGVSLPIHDGTFWPRGVGWLRPWVFHEPGREFEAHARRLAPQVQVRVLDPGTATEVTVRGMPGNG
jgi:hypothetical protein